MVIDGEALTAREYPKNVLNAVVEDGKLLGREGCINSRLLTMRSECQDIAVRATGAILNTPFE